VFLFGRVFVLSVLIHAPLHHSNGLGSVLAEPFEGEVSKFREMALSEHFSQGGESWTEEGCMGKCHQVSRCGTANYSIGTMCWWQCSWLDVQLP